MAAPLVAAWHFLCRRPFYANGCTGAVGICGYADGLTRVRRRDRRRRAYADGSRRHRGIPTVYDGRRHRGLLR